MNVSITVIPHDKQVYPTVGDWRFDKKGNINIFISDMGNWRMEMLVAIHELAEVLMCLHDDVTTEEVDAFDADFEDKRQEGNEDEPGDAKNAPYRRQHCLATAIERLMCAELGIVWEEYDKKLNSL